MTPKETPQILRMTPQNKKRFILILIMFFLAVIFIIYGNFAISQVETINSTNYKIESDKVTKEYRIVHLSDFFGDIPGNRYRRKAERSMKAPYRYSKEKMYDIIIEFNPNFIVVTGDMYNKGTNDTRAIHEFFQLMNDISPIYYVLGDSDYQSRFKENIENELTSWIGEHGVKILKGETVDYEELTILGIDEELHSSEEIEKQINVWNSHKYKIALNHKAQSFEQYIDYDIDLMLSGNTMGGKYHLPLIKHEKYHYGLFEQEDTKMIVSAGIGSPNFDFIIPQRINNPREIVLITIAPVSDP